MVKEMQAVFGPELKIRPEQDLYALAARRAEEKGELPSILCCCGSGDPFIAMNRDFAAYMQGTRFDFRYVEGPGTHDWLFWEEHLKTAFDFLYEYKNQGERGDAI
ncbi:MAG: hypothetical protein E6230_12855 [Paenibacillus dendritiformis]|uniref:hypothetical protein n=1 Tax=uncultured Paenibacillus sp. TaxID=227322 RepID=UPI0025F35131|nr:hypothetical protein [uncultured Paenibacillus sp.]MDU5143066.1 hypothetical protein [Paenibacillus dendritiformis]